MTARLDLDGSAKTSRCARAWPGRVWGGHGHRSQERSQRADMSLKTSYVMLDEFWRCLNWIRRRRPMTSSSSACSIAARASSTGTPGIGSTPARRRVYDLPHGRCLELDAPLLSVDAITNGDDTTLETSLYNLYPLNGPHKTEIRTSQSSNVTWRFTGSGDTEGVIHGGTWATIDRSATDPESLTAILNSKSAVLMLALALYKKRYGVGGTASRRSRARAWSSPPARQVDRYWPGRTLQAASMTQPVMRVAQVASAIAALDIQGIKIVDLHQMKAALTDRDCPMLGPSQQQSVVSHGLDLAAALAAKGKTIATRSTTRSIRAPVGSDRGLFAQYPTLIENARKIVEAIQALPRVDGCKSITLAGMPAFGSVFDASGNSFTARCSRCGSSSFRRGTRHKTTTAINTVDAVVEVLDQRHDLDQHQRFDQQVEVSAQTADSGMAASLEGQYKIVRGGKYNPVDITVTIFFTETAGEAYEIPYSQKNVAGRPLYFATRPAATTETTAGTRATATATSRRVASRSSRIRRRRARKPGRSWSCSSCRPRNSCARTTDQPVGERQPSASTSA